MSVAVPHIPGDGKLDTLLGKSIGLKCMSIKINCSVQRAHNCTNGVCSAHQTPGLLYQPVWGERKLRYLGQRVGIPQM